LHDIRVSRGLPIQDIATRLRLHVRTLERLESDDYEALHAPTFARGYLRGYARALEIPETPFLQAFDALEREPPPLVSDIAGRSEAKSTDFPVRVVTHAIAALLLLLVAIWWQSRPPSPGGGPGPDIASIAATAPAIASTMEAASLASDAVAETSVPAAKTDSRLLNDAFASGPDARVTASSTESVGGTENLSSGTEAAPPEESVVTSGSESSQDAVSSDQGETSASDLSVTPEQPAASGSMSSESVVPAISKPSDARLKLALASDSWIEVYDREDNKLYYALAKGGRTIDISGSAPFRVLLGYARGVSVEFNGEAFDHSAHMDRGIARFVLGGPLSSTEHDDGRPPPNEVQGAVDLTRLLISPGGAD
jgi:cytoskeleton protein RodZ